ncbi:MAG: hypothetical protein A3J83_08195 [Elusimicrobia bacterium RIFOXYA2_FULL_40_6]|nr:MAG: hypothetical protein A3J83_08195 [Elusimicrobia bacterium RIFOXYA2_FULL_40_6]
MKNKWVKIAVPIFATVLLMYAMVYIDVTLRARSAYLEAEKYSYWHGHPEAKKQALQEKLNVEIKKLDVKLAKKKISKEDYDRETEVAKFNHGRELEESSIKYAYVWYQTVIELFSPPESKWVKLSRQKLPAAKTLWRKELESKGIKVEDYMLE